MFLFFGVNFSDTSDVPVHLELFRGKTNLNRILNLETAFTFRLNDGVLRTQGTCVIPEMKGLHSALA